MLPWQERVVAEKKDLDDKIEKLFDFMNDKDKTKMMTKDDIDLLADQQGHMLDYSDVLQRRIARFS